MNTLTVIFLVFLVASLAVRQWLLHRHLGHILGHRGAVPADFRDRITLVEHQKAADYTATKLRFNRWDLVVEALILLTWTLGGGLDLLDGAWRALELGPLHTGVAVLLSIALISMLIDLPVAAYQTFVIEEQFGFNRTTPRVFLADHAKQLVLLVALMAPLLYAVLWILDNAGSLWWFYAWLIWLGFSLTLVWAYPVLIAPLFNRFEPLDEGEVRSRVEDLLARNDLSSDGIFVMDGSRRSGHGNAYFTGFGKHKRIVFFDTLLKSLAPDEVEAVLAHEVGHFKRRHVIKRIAMSTVTSLAGLALVGWLMNQPWFYHGLGVSNPSGYAALALFFLVLPVFTFVLQPLGAWLSRRHEFEADEFAARQADGGALINALVKLYQENAATLTPDPLYSAFHDSHPPAPLRVAHLKAIGQASG
ncbi:MAG: M48 family metallopeptidase [Gammaproteobacteria bacterium]|nr:M48 family metallopeptidase [Gammaproteobacteria bacterium]